MNEPEVTIVGNVAGEVALRFAPSGVAVVRFTLVNGPRKFNKVSSEWEDETPLWVRVTAFKGLAENVAETCEKGSRVIVSGKLKREEWDDAEGAKREALVLIADDIGPSLKFATAKINKVGRGSQQKATPAKATDDPWASSPDDSEPPF